MEAHNGNKDSADELRNLARAAMKLGDLEGAMRRLSKSQRMYPSPETESLLARVQAEIDAARDRTSGGGGKATNGEAAGAREPTGSSSDGSGGGSGMRQRRVNGTAEASEAETTATVEQVTLVRRILRTKENFYEVLEVSRTCTEDEVKKSYRKLSLKVHPDKNKAPGAEDAFKAVSRAFKCLTDPQLRANYDNYGHEDPNQSRLQQQHRRQQAAAENPFAGHPFFQDDFDPNDIFNSFFGVHTVNGRVYVNRRGFPSQRRQAPRPQGGEEEGFGRAQLFGFLQLLPFLFFLLFFVNLNTDPLYKRQKIDPYNDELRTDRLKVPYYVKSAEEFSKKYPQGTPSRWRVERTVESEYRELLESHCYHERLHKAQVLRWGGKEQAKKYEMPHCDELQRVTAVL